MDLAKKIDQDMVAAMKAHDVERTQTLRMVKAALKNRQIEKRSELTAIEGQQVLTTMIKQRKESIEQFQRGNRPELAAKEAREILLIESYMPKAASEEDLKKMVEEALAGMNFGPRDMGAAMKTVQAKIQETGMRADGRVLSDLVKGKLQGTGSGE
ncbi:MAG TPA: GatB/YqeY domain-containing protein [Acidobacteriaceae bacterium]|nr:GatB/YqeY domain-containing protein [Acidobacteriaceae bacterium]